MARLTHGQFDKLLGSICELHAHHDLDSFAALAMTLSRKLVASDYAILEEMNLRRKRHSWVTDPPGVDLSGPAELHEYYFKEHPMVLHLGRTGDMPPLRLSDFFSQRQFRETALYNEVFRGFGVEYQLGFSLPSSSPRFYVAMAFHRKHSNFSEQDKLVFELLRPHLFQAYRNAEHISLLQEQVRYGEQALEFAHQGTIVLDGRGRVRFCSEAARQWITSYFAPLKSAEKNPLPEAIRQWVRLQQLPTAGTGHLPQACQPLTVERNGRRLVVRLVAGAFPGEQLLMLDERATTFSPVPLQRLGLTAREAEVLFWATQGKTSPDIGVILSCGTATVNKHMEHIFAKLGVETRTAAASQAFEVLYGNGS